MIATNGEVISSASVDLVVPFSPISDNLTGRKVIKIITALASSYETKHSEETKMSSDVEGT